VAGSATPIKNVWNRLKRVQVVWAAGVGRALGRPVSLTAAEADVPTSTAYRWLAAKEAIDAPAVERDFYLSPEGLAALHRIVTAAHLVFVQAGGCGVDRVSEFLRLSHLDRFVAPSHGSQQAVAARMAALLGEYADQEWTRLGATMPPRRIVVCEDETFHPAICLVAIDAESGLILVECYSERRDGATWTQALAEALAGLPVEVVRVVGDEAKGLIAHARSGLGVEHGADLFHVQHDLSRATALSLSRRLERPREWLALAQADTQAERDAQTAYQIGPRGPGRPPNFQKRIAAAQVVEDERRAAYEAVVADQAKVREAIRELGDAYHPVHLITGVRQSVEQVRSRFDAALATIDEVAERAQLPERCRDRIDKARRVLPKLVAGVAFFYAQLDRALADLNLSPAVDATVRTQLLAGLYLQRAAGRARDAAERAAFKALSAKLLAQAYDPASAFMTLDEFSRRHVEAVIQAQLALFVRSSACVEGRNGHLARFHHGLHRLSKRRLKALTTIANFYTRRTDGTTAAERFFGQPPEDLFEWLLTRMDLPAQPRAKRLRLAA
jgi:hypothetical protein